MANLAGSRSRGRRMCGGAISSTRTTPFAVSILATCHPTFRMSCMCSSGIRASGASTLATRYGDTMDIGIEISLYPLTSEFIPPIEDFIARLNRDKRFKVVTNSMSTQIFGSYESLLDALNREMRVPFERAGKSVFVMKVLGPFAAA